MYTKHRPFRQYRVTAKGCIAISPGIGNPFISTMQSSSMCKSDRGVQCYGVISYCVSCWMLDLGCCGSGTRRRVRYSHRQKQFGTHGPFSCMYGCVTCARIRYELGMRKVCSALWRQSGRPSGRCSIVPRQAVCAVSPIWCNCNISVHHAMSSRVVGQAKDAQKTVYRDI
jgi:hypothetical protein